MNAAVVHAYDAPPSYASFTDPVAADGEMLVTVTAAALHPIVKSLANGSHYGSTGKFPFIPGVDGAGKKENGTRVFFGAGRPPYGTFAEKTIASPLVCLPLPDTLDDVTAAAIGNPGMSSWAALKFRAKFATGESVLILGATGVAGKLSIQIAKRLGARRVIAVGRNPQALEELKSLGADAVIALGQEHDALVAAYRKEFAENGVDVVLDYLWGEPAETLLSVVSQKGLQHSSPRIRYIQIGNSAGPNITLAGATLRSSGLELLGSGFGSVAMEEIGKSVGEFFQEAAKKPFVFDVKAVPLREIGAYWNASEQGTRLVFQP
ncbi:zinc-binding alcohol dehydrogenase family protein [Acidobacterium sp. S8]|uniref:quinone oxidoreductase family protein n=1 Tax=Acidobacterium sp. S8 TaxID=1641854 RepID=UPI00131B27A7|nr:zinc-binding alcohol dehydrogenase family protein [Acidobacterium sp. S8]